MLAVAVPRTRIRIWRGETVGRIRTLIAPLAAVALVGTAMVTPSGKAATAHVSQKTHELVHVIVTGTPGAAADAARAVKSEGGQVLHALPIVNGFDANVPADAIDRIAATTGVRSITPDAHLQPKAAAWPGSAPYDAEANPGSMYNVVREIGADQMWKDGFTGKGVGVAIIDSGVAPVDAMKANLVNGPDLSLDADGGALDGVDAFGHGTHLAGIIAGRAPKSSKKAKELAKADPDQFLGVAPDATLINVKVAAFDGSVDVSQVIAGINWVVEHRNDKDLKIRVLNLAYGTDGVQDYQLDPLTFAAEVAWRAGIVVVVSAGNNGLDHPQMNNPAYDPFVLAVGAQDQNGTVATNNDVIADFSSRGVGWRRPAVLAPGRSVVSLRDPGSWIDEDFSTARVGTDLFKGSGTSQATAVTSGAVALVLQRYPKLTPDQVKYAFQLTGRRLTTSDGITFEQGVRTLELDSFRDESKRGVAYAAAFSNSRYAAQNYPPALGLGSLEGARGSFHLSDGTNDLQGEIDVTGAPWNPQTFTALSLQGRTWSGNSWLGRTWSGRTWSGRTWSGRTWSGNAFAGRTWSGRTWSGTSWASRTWSGMSWSGRTWSGRTWSSADLDPRADTGA